MEKTYYGDGGRLSGAPQDILVQTAFAHDSQDAQLLLPGLHTADIAYAIMLAEQGVIPEAEARRLLVGLTDISRIPPSRFPVDPADGDVYNSKDAILREVIGEDAGWIHVGRPRREAVNIAYLLVTRERLEILGEALLGFARALRALAWRNRDVVAPDYTYLLHAHPTRLDHYLTTFMFNILRDMDRIREAHARINRSPAGSGSVNGSSLPLNRQRMATLLGFAGIISHSRDAMWQVDMPIEIASDLVMITTNLNRLANELQIWNSSEFGTVELPDSLCRASVIMPQKKNPYPLAYIRGVGHWIAGKVSSFAAYGAGPSGNPDSRTFVYGELPEALSKVSGALDLFAAILDGITFDAAKSESRVAESFAFATDISDFLTYRERIDYRTSHTIAGRLVRNMAETGETARDLTPARIAAAAEDVTGRKISIPAEFVSSLKDPKTLVDLKKTEGGAGRKAMDSVFTEIDSCMADFQTWIDSLDVADRFDTLNAAILDWTLPSGTFLQQFLKCAQKTPDKVAIIEGSEREVTYGQLFNHACSIYEGLGDREGTRIALLLSDKIQLMAAIVATHMARGTVVCIDVAEAAAFETMIRDAQPALLLYDTKSPDAGLLEAAGKAAPDMTYQPVGPAPACAGATAREMADFDVVEAQPDAIAHLFYTSGTTGHRKGVAISQSAYTVPANVLNLAMKHDGAVKEYIYGDIAHAFPFGRIRAVLLAGGTAVLDNGKPLAPAILARLKEHACNIFSAPSSVVVILMRHYRDDFTDLSGQLRVIKVGTQALQEDVKTELLSHFPHTHVFQQYGASESPRTVFNELSRAAGNATTGRVLPGYAMSIRDDQDRPVFRRNATGRVWLKGPHIASHYWNRPDRSSESFRQGWYVTDDLGSIDDDGQLHLLGRVDEVINFGGQKLSPADIEDVLHAHMVLTEKGADFFVFGIEDPQALVGTIPAIIRAVGGDTPLERDPDWPKIRMKIIKNAGSLDYLPKHGFRIGALPVAGSGKPRRKWLASEIKKLRT